MNVAATLDGDDIGAFIVFGMCILVLAMVLLYQAGKYRSNNEVKIAQEATKQADLYRKAAEADLKAAELKARPPQAQA